MPLSDLRACVHPRCEFLKGQRSFVSLSLTNPDSQQASYQLELPEAAAQSPATALCHPIIPRHSRIPCIMIPGFPFTS